MGDGGGGSADLGDVDVPTTIPLSAPLEGDRDTILSLTAEG